MNLLCDEPFALAGVVRTNHSSHNAPEVADSHVHYQKEDSL